MLSSEGKESVRQIRREGSQRTTENKQKPSAPGLLWGEDKWSPGKLGRAGGRIPAGASQGPEQGVSLDLK